MGKLAVWLIGLLLLSLIYAACVHFRVDNIEFDLKDRATIALIKKELTWVRVAVDGRDIIIDGVAPDEDARVHAGQVAASIWGVRAIENRTAIVNNSTNPSHTVTAKPKHTAIPTKPESHSVKTDVQKIVESPPAETVTKITSPALNCQHEINKLLSQQRVEFEIASYEINGESYSLLNTLIGWLNTCPDTKIEVGGHTDSIGDEQENISLSLARAEAVARYLQRSGIRGSRLSAVGYGSALPLDTNQTADGRRRNRRIEIQINQ